MLDEQRTRSSNLVYEPHLDRIQESVISSHFMSEIANNAELRLYDDATLTAKSQTIGSATVFGVLLPTLVNASAAFAAERAAAARVRAKTNYRDYGLSDPESVGTAECVTEAMLDRQFSRSRNLYSKTSLHAKVTQTLRSAATFNLVIPALPFKIPSPLKSRGGLPDLVEMNFILGLYEVVRTIELICRQDHPATDLHWAKFTVVSDGSRFSRLVNAPENDLRVYRKHLHGWVERLGLGRYVEIQDYQELLRDRLPKDVLREKARIFASARTDYSARLSPVFDPMRMKEALRAVADIDPDPETSNAEGRFVSLLHSLVFTMKYRTLEPAEATLHPDAFSTLYRDLTSHLFEPYVACRTGEPGSLDRAKGEAGCTPATDDREPLRRSMLREVWDATILYMAEIKSDRELLEDPILTCLPGFYRWTIHAKRGQLALLTSAVLGRSVQAWAGSAVIKRTKSGKLRIAALPVLLLEGMGATPVFVEGAADEFAASRQPFFYVYPDVAFGNAEELVSRLEGNLVRQRVS